MAAQAVGRIGRIGWPALLKSCASLRSQLAIGGELHLSRGIRTSACCLNGQSNTGSRGGYNECTVRGINLLRDPQLNKVSQPQTCPCCPSLRLLLTCTFPRPGPRCYRRRCVTRHLDPAPRPQLPITWAGQCSLLCSRSHKGGSGRPLAVQLFPQTLHYLMWKS